MSTYVGKGITITTNFDVAAKIPLDSRTIVDNESDLSALANAYEGLLVYVKNKKKLYQCKALTPEIEWGPVDAEVSARTLALSSVNVNSPSLMMQKNGADFFPIVHDKYVVDNNKKDLATRLAAINTTITNLQNTVNDVKNSIKQEIQGDLDDLLEQIDEAKATIDKEVANLNKTINTSITNMQNTIDSKMAQIDKTFEEKLKEIESTVSSLETDIENRISSIMNNVDKIILTQNQLDDFMKQINANLTALNSL